MKQCKFCNRLILNRKGSVDLKTTKTYCNIKCYNDMRHNQKVIREKLSDPEFFNAMIESIKGEMVVLGVEVDENGNFISPNAKTFDDEDYRI